MSSYKILTIHPVHRDMREAWWLDDYFGKHRYGVRFEGEEHVYRPSEIPSPLDGSPADA